VTAKGFSWVSGDCEHEHRRRALALVASGYHSGAVAQLIVPARPNLRVIDLRADEGSIGELPAASARALPDAARDAARPQSWPALALERLSAGLRHLPLQGLLASTESAAVGIADGRPCDGVALLGRRLARAARG
jgi:hypothetical protein